MGKIHFTVNDNQAGGKLHCQYSGPAGSGETVTTDPVIVDQLFCQTLGLVHESVPLHAINDDTGKPLIAVYIPADKTGRPLKMPDGAIHCQGSA